MIFDEIWRLEWKRNNLQRSYDKDIKKCKKAKNHHRADELDQEAAHFYSGATDQINALRSQKLVKKAIDLKIPTPDYSDETSWTNWYYGYVLTDKAYDELRARIMKFTDYRLEHRMRWVKLVLIPIGTFILGIITTYLTIKHNTEQQSQTQQEHKVDQSKQH